MQCIGIEHLSEVETICASRISGPTPRRASATNKTVQLLCFRQPLTNTASAAADSFDGRSDDKGAEPEGLAIAEIDGRLVYHMQTRQLPDRPLIGLQWLPLCCERIFCLGYFCLPQQSFVATRRHTRRLCCLKAARRRCLLTYVSLGVSCLAGWCCSERILRRVLFLFGPSRYCCRPASPSV